MLDALQAVEAGLSERMGRFKLFGLFRRRRAPGWDLVVAAPWVDPGLAPTLELLSGEIERATGERALFVVSRILVNPDSRFVDAVLDTVKVEHGLKVVGPGDYGNVEIARGYVITSRRPAAAAPVTVG